MPGIAPTKFNQGQETSDTIERQFTPEYVLKAVIEMPKKKRPFSAMASVFAMAKNHGDTVTQEVRHGMMEEGNVLAGGIDSEHATLSIGKIYASNGLTYDVEEYLIEAGQDWNAAYALALADVAAASATVTSYEPSGIINGRSNLAAYTGAFLPLPEEGGILNGFKAKSTLISASLSWHMVHTKYTTRSIDLDSRVGMLARHISDLGDVVADAKEGQLQAALQTVANTNRTISTSNPLTILPSQIDGLDVLTFEVMEQYALDLQDADVPMDTELIKGIDLQDTLTVSDAYIAYVNRAVLPTLTRMKGADGSTIAWIDKKHYAAGTELIDGEVGTVDGLPFRFVVVDNLQVERGAGEVVGSANDGANAATGASAYSTRDMGTDNTGATSRYDVYSMLVIGDDSFSVTGFGYNSTKAVHIAPKRDNHNDMTASVGGVVADWSFALLAYRPERVSKISYSIAKSGGLPVAK